MFRYERPQAGRFRQVHQFGVEVIGSNDPAVDAEVISLAWQFYKGLGIQHIKLLVNSLGDDVSRIHHRDAMQKHFKDGIGSLCSDCQNRYETNPLRILDCKKDAEHPLIQSAPKLSEYLSQESKDFFSSVKNYLDALSIPYEINDRLVRGLDYYTHTTFEIILDLEGYGTGLTLCGGGRYQGLVEQLGGVATSGVGFGIGVERVLQALEAEGIQLPIQNFVDCFFIAMGNDAKKKVFSILYELRKAGLSVEMDYVDRKMKGQFAQAERLQARYVGIIGDDEFASKTITLKEQKTGNQENIPFGEIETFLKGYKKHE
jgi:histidyl-tRNA synthetase